MFAPRASIASIVVLVLLSSGCFRGMGTIRYSENDEIPVELRNEVHALNQVIVDGLLNGDSTGILTIYADDIKGRPNFESELDSVVEAAAPMLAGVDIDLFHEFDITCSKENPEFTWAVVSDLDNGFIVHVNAIRRRMFFTLMEAKGSFEDKLIGAHYIFDNDSWRLFELRINTFRIGGRSALEWGHEARRLLEDDFAVAAQLRFSVATSIIRPLPQVQYVREDELLELGESIRDELAALPQLPLTLEELPSEPTIYAISPHFVDRQLIAVVQYVSSLELSDDILAPEVAAISDELAAHLPGLCAASELVAYRAFAEAPTDPSKQYEYYGIPYDCSTSAKPAI